MEGHEKREFELLNGVTPQCRRGLTHMFAQVNEHIGGFFPKREVFCLLGSRLLGDHLPQGVAHG